MELGESIRLVNLAQIRKTKTFKQKILIRMAKIAYTYLNNTLLKIL